MRVISGTLKGRRIPFNNRKQGHARVTSERVKKAVFSSLGETFLGLRFLDLFSGSGQIGLEALSRGAQVIINEPDRRLNRFIAGLIEDWDLENHVQLHGRPAEKLIPLLEAQGLFFDIIYLDPPYHQSFGDAPMALAFLSRLSSSSLLSASSTLVIQHPTRLSLPETQGNLSLKRQKKYGDTTITAYEKHRS